MTSPGMTLHVNYSFCIKNNDTLKISNIFMTIKGLNIFQSCE